MDYVKGIFKNRPNRFIAEVEVDGEMEIAHVPNTGRCKELLVDDAVVWLKPSDNPNRKTKFSLHFVENKGVLVSLYSQQANSIVYDAVVTGKIKELSGYDYHQREKTVDNSRIDIYLENSNGDSCFVEVKGVTLIIDGEARFPDAPTERGAKHLKELIKLKKEGNRCCVFFLILFQSLFIRCCQIQIISEHGNIQAGRSEGPLQIHCISRRQRFRSRCLSRDFGKCQMHTGKSLFSDTDKSLLKRKIF